MTPQPPGKVFGDRLTQLMEETTATGGGKWTAARIAEDLNDGYSYLPKQHRQTISKLAAGTGPSPSFDQVCAISDLFGVPYGFFYDDHATAVPAALLDPGRAIQNGPMQRLLACAGMLAELDIKKVTQDIAERVALTLPAGVEDSPAAATLPKEVRDVLKQRRAIE